MYFSEELFMKAVNNVLTMSLITQALTNYLSINQKPMKCTVVVCLHQSAPSVLTEATAET